MRLSAGTLLYRTGPKGLEVLLVHASGNYNRHKPWSIPKGEPDEGEEPEAAARRETREEAGVEAQTLRPLGTVKYKKSGKTIYAFAGPAPGDAAPFTASWEVDQACFLSLAEARTRLHPDQLPFLDRLVEMLRTNGSDAVS
jgi:predicted NUDIX family NTP pyrophosphohydrolase